MSRTVFSTTAFLSSNGIVRVRLKVYFIVGGFSARHLLFAQVPNVVGHFGHEFGSSIS